MDDHELKLIKKRKYSRTKKVESQKKRRRLIITSEAIMTIDSMFQMIEPIQPTTITDLNDECLEVIFMQLNVEDFLNVAASNKWLNMTAGLIFRRLHGHKTINFETNVAENAHSIGIDNILLINGFRACLQCLRCFGSYITNIGIQFTGTSVKQSNYIKQYLNEYCVESLLSITFKNVPNLVGKNEQKQCQNVECVYIMDCKLFKQLSSFNKWFPNLNRLELINNTINPKFAATHFPHLKEFRFFVICQYRTKNALKQFLSLFLNSNSHIQSLEIDIQQMECKDILKFNEFLTMMQNNSSIIKLKTNYGIGGEMRLEHLYSLAETLPSLVEIDFRAYILPADESITFVQRMKLLKYFRCGLWIGTNHDHFRAQFDDKWQVLFETANSVISSSLVTLRR